MIRLPSAALARSSVPLVPAGDFELPASCSDYEDEDTSSSAASVVVQRSRFFLRRGGSADFEEAYELERKPLGEGGFGTVHLARLRSAGSVESATRAVKLINKRRLSSEEDVWHEASVLKRLDHPHICRLFEAFEGGKYVYLVMEYVEGQELFDFIHKSFTKGAELDQDFVTTVMRHVFDALHYCHQRQVVHRDLKPENVMVQRMLPRPGRNEGDLQVKLIDFGLATVLHRARPATATRPSALLAGCGYYLAPEATGRAGSCAGPASDLWSAGMVLHALLLGNLPPEAVRRGAEPLDVSIQRYEQLPWPAKDLIHRLLQVDAALRPSAAQAADLLWTADSIMRASSGASLSQKLNETMEAFLDFHQSTLLRRAVLTALAMQLGGQQLLGLREQFLHLDRDKNGRISKEELAMSIDLSDVGDVDLPDKTREWFECIFDAVDTDGSKEIEYTEFLAAALADSMLITEEATRAAFRAFDIDGSGKISQKEFARVVMQTPADIANLLPQFDLNRDGAIDFEEFETMIRQAPTTLTERTGSASACGSDFSRQSWSSRKWWTSRLGA